MTGAAQAAAYVAAAINVVAAAWGGLLWYRVDDAPPAVWRFIRAAQASLAVHALVVGGLYLGGLRPGSDLYALYVGLPIAVSFVAEQFRALAAQTILDARGLEDAGAVGKLEPAAQRSIVVAILRRELGVLVLGCAVSVFLLLRAASTV